MKKLDFDKIFTSDPGQEIYSSAVKAIEDFSMQKMLSGGVLVGFSGGADSVALLVFLNEYSKRNGNFKVCAVHVNHGIRGKEAERDENFARDFCEDLGIEFILRSYDVPMLAKERVSGLEETARFVRYSAFEEIISGRDDLSCVAVAHNATDNVETVFMNMLRGSGTRGLAGIPPIRDKVIRPLIYARKYSILRALIAAEIPYVSDSTNNHIEYTRNYIRHEVLTKLYPLYPCPEKAITRLSSNLRADDAFITEVAQEFLKENYKESYVRLDALARLHEAVFARVVAIMAEDAGCECEHVHIERLFQLVARGGDFSISLPGKQCFVSQNGKCYIGIPVFEQVKSYSFSLKMGINTFNDFDGAIILSKTPFLDSSLKNVYKIAIQQAIDSAIINGELFVRSKKPGDSYRYGGMTHKLKKIFNDKGVPVSRRPLVPIFCDEEGIIWVPGLGVRSVDKPIDNKEVLYISLAYKKHYDKNDGVQRFYSIDSWEF